VRPRERAYTQNELIERALDMEERNTTEHRNYLSVEEDKRQRARVVRAAVHGPVIRWISRSVDLPPDQSSVLTSSPPEHALSPAQEQEATRVADADPGSNVSKYGFAYTGWSTTPAVAELLARSSALPSTSRTSVPHHAVAAEPSPFPVWPTQPPRPAAAKVDVPPLSSMISTAQAPASSTTEAGKVVKNFVVHELDQAEDTDSPSWKDTMQALFGQDIAWDELRVYVGRGRPYGEAEQIYIISTTNSDRSAAG
jgi:hypothetical protein